MSTILGFFFLVIIIVLIFGLSLISTVLRVLFGFGRKSTSQNQQNRTHRNTYHTEEKENVSRNASPNNPNRKKIFDKDEGEYVDFEEVKDEDK